MNTLTDQDNKTTMVTAVPTPQVIRRRRWLVAITALVAIVAGAGVAYLMVLDAETASPTIESAPVGESPGNAAPVDAALIEGGADTERLAAAVEALTVDGGDADESAGALDESSGATGAGGRFVDVPTTRLLDTREGGEMATAPTAGESVETEIGEVLPADGVSTVVLSVNVAMAQEPGAISVAAGGESVTAIVVAGPGQMTTNLVFVPYSAGAPISVTTEGGGHLVVDLVGYFEETEVARAGRFVPVATQRLARLVTEVDGREAVVSPLANPALPASGVASVLVRITADVGGEGGMVRLGSDLETLPNTMMWAATSGDERTRQGVAVVSLSELDELAFTYNGGSVLDLDVLGYFTDDSALEAEAGLFVPTTEPDGAGVEIADIKVAAGVATTVDVAGTFSADPSEIGAVPVSVFATSDTPGELFVPMHWSGPNAPSARIDALVAPHVDPFSGQPESKATTVSAERFAAAWHGFAVSVDSFTPDSDYWARARTGTGYRCELAGLTAPEDWEGYARRLFGRHDAALQRMSDTRRGRHRLAFFDGDTLLAALYVGPEPVPLMRDFLVGLPGSEAPWALAGQARGDTPDPGPVVCSCYAVGVHTIRRAVESEGLTSVDQIGASLSAGTNCGSCKAELASILGEVLARDDGASDAPVTAAARVGTRPHPEPIEPR